MIRAGVFLLVWLLLAAATAVIFGLMAAFAHEGEERQIRENDGGVARG